MGALIVSGLAPRPTVSRLITDGYRWLQITDLLFAAVTLHSRRRLPRARCGVRGAGCCDGGSCAGRRRSSRGVAAAACSRAERP